MVKTFSKNFKIRVSTFNEQEKEYLGRELLPGGLAAGGLAGGLLRTGHWEIRILFS